jgi:signal transduction histidine kinase
VDTIAGVTLLIGGGTVFDLVAGFGGSAGSNGGKIAVADGGTLRLSAVSVGSDATLRVEDEGVGIPPEEVEKIFQPFRGSFGKGTGLGLAIVHRIVTDYDGDIEVMPRSGGGTIFRVTFPAAVSRPEALQAS